MPNKPSVFIEVGIVTMALLVRLIQLNGSFWLDEAAQAIESARPLGQQLQILPDFQPPLYHLLVHFWLMGGTSEWWLRLTSLIPGLITVWLTIKIGQKLYNEHVGQIAGALLAVSQFHLYYSQELRPYSLAACLAMAACYAWLNLPRKTAWWGLTLALVAGVYTTYLFPTFILCLLGVSYFRYRSKWKPLLLSTLIAGIAFIPWIPTFIGQIKIGTSLAAASSVWSQIVSPPFWKMIPLTLVKFSYGRINLTLGVRDIAIVGVLFLGYLYTLAPAISNPKGKQLIGLAFGPIMIAWLISVFVPVLDPKRVLFCLPLILIMVAQGIGQSLRSAVLLMLLFAVNMTAINQYAVNPDDQREPWREAITRLETVVAPDEKVVFAFPEAFAPWQWYAHPRIPALAIVPESQSQADELVTQDLAMVNKVYVFDYLMDVSDPHRYLNQALAGKGFHETGYFQYPGIGKIRILERAKGYAWGGGLFSSRS